MKDGADHNPRFTSTVTINGVSFSSHPNECRSSKEAQNQAAQIAFYQLSNQSSIPTSNLSGPSSSSTSADINSQQHAFIPNKQTPFACREEETSPKEILHTFKNRLQHFTQKHNLSMPAYCSEFEGPPHARRFRSKVIIADKTYQSSQFFPTLKEAEHAAAKVAFETLSHDDIQEDETLYKTLLQELAQKKGLQFPKYTTVRSGPSHVPTFVSTVEIGTDVFQGLEARTKKQAEMSAAKVAYNALLKHREEQGPSGYQIKGIPGVTSFTLQPTVDKGLVHPSNMGEAAANKECVMKEALTKECVMNEALTISASSAHIVTDGQHGIQPTMEQTSVKKLNADQDAKIEGQQSSNSELHVQLQYSSPLTSSPEPSSFATVNHPSKHHTPAGAGHKSSRKYIVYPKDVRRETPEAASIMPYSDDQYVALNLKDTTMQ